LLDMLDSVIHTECVPSIINIQADYWLTYRDTAITSSRSRYPISSRSVMSSVVSVYRLNADKTDRTPLKLRYPIDTGINDSGDPFYHTFEDDSVVVSPIPATSDGYIRIYYTYLPSSLVSTSACMAITGGVSTGILTGSVPAGWTTALSYDIFSAESPFSIIHSDLTASSVAGGSITFTLSDLDTVRLSSGSYYVGIAGTTCFPMLPASTHNLISDMVVAKVREEIGDEGFVQKYQLNSELLKRIIDSTVPRKKTETLPIINRSSLYRLF
jgi:hypothetical protein